MNEIIRSYFTLTCLIFLTLAFGSNSFAADKGICKVGMELGPGDSCTVPTTTNKITVDRNGIAEYAGTKANRSVLGPKVTHKHARDAAHGWLPHGNGPHSDHTHTSKTPYPHLKFVENSVTIVEARNLEDGTGRYRIVTLGTPKDKGTCAVGLVIGRGERCTYPDSTQTFRVSQIGSSYAGVFLGTIVSSGDNDMLGVTTITDENNVKVPKLDENGDFVPYNFQNKDYVLIARNRGGGSNKYEITHIGVGSSPRTQPPRTQPVGPTIQPTPDPDPTPTATTLESVTGSGQSSETGSAIANPFVVRVLDQNGAAMSGVSVSFSVTPGGTVNPSNATTGSNGQAETRLTLGGTTGIYTVTARASSITQTVTFTATATAPDPLAFRPSAIAAQTFAVGNTIQPLRLPVATGGTAPYTYSLSPIPAGLSFSSAARLLSGTPTTATTATTITYTARDAAGRSASLTFTITVTAPPAPPVPFPVATTLEFVSGSGQSGQTGSAIANPFVVRVLDQNRAVMSGVFVSFSVTLGGTVNPSSATTGSNGQAETRLTLGSTTGIYTVTASVSGITESVSFTATATAPVQPPQTDRSTPPSKLAAPGQISFSELMFTSRGGLHSLPQWIELYNNSDTETVNLRTWRLTIEARDADGTHRYGVIRLEELIIAPNTTALIVTWSARHSDDIQDSRVYNFFNHHTDEFEQNRHRNMVLGQEGFSLKLTDPYGAVSDTVGNIDGNRRTRDAPLWEIPEGTTQDGERTSLFRRYAKNTDNPLDGTDANNWRRAANFGRISDLPALAMSQYWGKKTDIGNPGYKGAGALPVELSSFRAVLKETGTVLTWTTESEQDNAGFNILRSVSKSGHFLKVNPNLIQGAGTTSERNTYSWTDTTAKPNTVYFYQIEDISYSGERTRFTAIRMKGYVSAQGKLATNWANLKNSMSRISETQ